MNQIKPILDQSCNVTLGIFHNWYESAKEKWAHYCVHIGTSCPKFIV